MTFDALKAKVMAHCNLTSADADTRVGDAINSHYRRTTATLGLDAARFVTRSVATSVGVRTVTFTSIEKIDRVIDATDSNAIRVLAEVSVNAQRTTQPASGQPTSWAFQNANPDSVTVLLDTIPQSAYSLQADGWTSLADLEGTEEPAFPESFHDILFHRTVSDELLKKEKDKLALIHETKADNLLKELRFFLADSHGRDVVQGSRPSASGMLGASGSGGTVGGTAYTQTALITFNLGASTAPFAVTPASATYVVNLGAEFLGNLTTDRLIGRDTTGTGESEQLTVGGGVEFTGSGGIQRSAISGDITIAAGSATAAIGTGVIVNADVNASAAIAWTKLSTTGSSLADLTTRSATDLTSGTVNEARLGSGTGSVHKVLRGNSTWGDSPAITTDGASAVQQIAFAATQSASAGANVLDDYEEGTWTPADGSGAALSLTASGHYVKIGQQVHAYFSILYPSTADTSTAIISGVPFTAQNLPGGAVSIGFSDRATFFWGEVIQNTQTIKWPNVNGTYQLNSGMTGTTIRGVAVYRASA